MKGNIYNVRSGAPAGLVIGKCEFGILVQWLDIHEHGHPQSFIFLQGQKTTYQAHPGAVELIPPIEFLGKTVVDTISKESLDAWMCDQQLQQSAQQLVAKAARR